MIVDDKGYNESQNDELFKNLNMEVYNSVSNSLVGKRTKDGDQEVSYLWNNIPVPRVTLVLQKTINKDGLLYWAARIGTKALYAERKNSTEIGRITHSLIEYFLKTGRDNTEMDVSNIFFKNIQQIECAYKNFRNWYDTLIQNGNQVKIIATELHVSCPFYGGTIDCIAEINNAVYIIDWKTSKRISMEYYIQASAYMWLINNGYCPDVKYVDGIGIVRLDKEYECIEDSFLTYQIPEHAAYIDGYIRTFESLLYSYFNLEYIEQFEHSNSLLSILDELEDRYD